jgi:SAM-dependent methyltransferase
MLRHKVSAPVESAALDRRQDRLQDGLKHDREKHRYVDLERPFLTALGVTNEQHQLVPAMARKWKQINKFVEVLDHALAGTALAQAERLDVVDFGSGKGYLTFATHEHLRNARALPAFVAGVELREDMVALCNGAAQRLGLEGLRFEQGDVRSVVPPKIDIMIALHACDTATDDALAKGVQAGAALLVVAPCCQKELRPQLSAAPVLAPALRHGIFQERHAEFATDALRALLLEWAGYDTKVFEFISTEHTAKNLMIAATKRAGETRTEEAAARVRELAAFYGIKSQALARHFYFDLSK